MRQTIVTTLLLALVALTGQGQVKCHIEGELRDTTQGKTVVIFTTDTDLRVSDNYIKVEADAQGRFACDVEADRTDMYEACVYEQWQTGSWAFVRFLVEDGATVTLRFDDGSWAVTGGGPEQMQKIQMEAEADRLYLLEMREVDAKVEAELRPRIEELQAQGKNPMEDSLLVKRINEHSAWMNNMFAKYRAWEQEYYATHPMLYALYEIAVELLRRDDPSASLQLYHTAYENFRPEDPIHSKIRMLEAVDLLKPGNPYIDFEARTVEGEKVRVAPLYQGKVAVIDLWASWCGPCRQHSIDLIPIYEKYKDQGFTVIGIAREEEVGHMTRAAKKDGYPWQSLVDLKDELRVWEKNGLSFAGGGMYLIDRDGTILSASSEADELEPLIRKALGLPELPLSGWQAEAAQNRVENDPDKPFTDFAVVYQGKTTRLSDYVGRGQYALVDFWASWCVPCLMEVPNLISAYSNYKDKGLQVLGVAVSDKPAHSERAIKDNSINYPQILNAQDVAKKAYGISSIPYIILFNPDGTICAQGLRGEEIGKKLEEIFGQP